MGIPAFLAVIGYFYRIQDLKKNSARTALYILLEVRFFIYGRIYKSTCKNDYELNLIIEHVKENIVKKNPDLPTEALNKIIELGYNQAKNLLNKHQEKEPTELSDYFLLKYEDSLFDLSKSYPTLAFTLRGKDEIKNLIDVIEHETKKIEDQDEHGRFDFSEVTSLILIDLDYDIKKLSKYCGIRARLTVKNYLKKPPRNKNDLLKSKHIKLLMWSSMKVLNKEIKKLN